MKPYSKREDYFTALDENCMRALGIWTAKGYPLMELIEESIRRYKLVRRKLSREKVEGHLPYHRFLLMSLEPANPEGPILMNIGTSYDSYQLIVIDKTGGAWPDNLVFLTNRECGQLTQRTRKEVERLDRDNLRIIMLKKYWADASIDKTAHIEAMREGHQEYWDAAREGVIKNPFEAYWADEERVSKRKNKQRYIVEPPENPDGSQDVIPVWNLKAFCEKEGLRYRSMRKVLDGVRKIHRGYRVFYYNQGEIDEQANNESVAHTREP